MRVFCCSTMIPKTLLVKLKAPRMGAPMCTLIGPPEIQSFVNQLKIQTLPETSNGHKVKIETSPEKPAIRDPFVDCMVSNFNTTQLPRMGLTENLSPTYLSSGNPCLDFFFHVVPDTPFQSVQERLQKAWDHDPLTSLKLICNLRGVRGTGKSDREGFYASAHWLHQFHPKTLAGNISVMASFGYIKDLPEILYRLIEGIDVRNTQKAQFMSLRRKITVKGRSKYYTPGSKTKTGEEKRIEMAKKVMEKYHKDSAFRFLHERVSDFFAECLKADMEYLKSNQTRKVSFAAKWCPSLNSSFDKSTLLCESIARKVFPRESYPEYEGLEDAHYAYRVRDRLRKEVLVPLRKVLELPEVYMSLNKWGEIHYSRVASVAMDLYKELFVKHDQERFQKYLDDVKSGKKKIAAGALLPHDIIKSLRHYNTREVAELQWKRMVDDLAMQGKFKNCMAICDVSGSMTGTPMEVSVALGLLVSELSEEPWKGKLITFSENPTLQIVKGETLLEKVNSIKRMDWDMNTDFQKVFDLILEVAVNGKLKEEDMIKRLFVFSDMEFDQASSSSYDRVGYHYGHYYMQPKPHSSWETDYEAIVRKFTEKGYGNAVPEIVFWNLRDSKSTPIIAGKQGVALVSGFSKNILKLFLNGDGYIDPVPIMEAAISGKEYQSLSVID